jgi:hypothetical protein
VLAYAFACRNGAAKGLHQKLPPLNAAGPAQRRVSQNSFLLF